MSSNRVTSIIRIWSSRCIPTRLEAAQPNHPGFSTLVDLLMKALFETSLSFVLCSSALSHDHSLNLPVSFQHIMVFTDNLSKYLSMTCKEKDKEKNWKEKQKKVERAGLEPTAAVLGQATRTASRCRYRLEPLFPLSSFSIFGILSLHDCHCPFQTT